MIEFLQKSIFYKNIVELNIANRYGHVMKEKNISIVEIESLFYIIMEDKIVERLMKKLKEHDYITYLHSLDVFILTYIFGERKDISYLRGALLHDVGKLFVSKELLTKNAKLKPDEYDEIMTHAFLGYKLLKGLDFEAEADIARSHHEKMDGTGYPDNLKSKEIDYNIRLITIMDVYSALTLERPYKKAFSNEKALNIFEETMIQYDEYILNQFMREITLY